MIVHNLQLIQILHSQQNKYYKQRIMPLQPLGYILILAKNVGENLKIKKNGKASKNFLPKNTMISKSNKEQPPCKWDIIKLT